MLILVISKDSRYSIWAFCMSHSATEMEKQQKGISHEKKFGCTYSPLRNIIEQLRSSYTVIKQRLPGLGAADLVGARRRRKQQFLLGEAAVARDAERGRRGDAGLVRRAELQRDRGAAARRLRVGMDARRLVSERR